MAVAAAALLAVALPNDLLPLGSPLFGVVALAPLLVAIYASPSYKSAAMVGLVFGGLSSILTNFWLLFFQSFSVWTLGGVTVAYIGFSALLAPILRALAAVPRIYRPFAVACGWALYEYLKSVGFLGYPWGLIAYPVHDLLPLVQFVEITGVWGLSLLMALVNAVAAEWLGTLLEGTSLRAAWQQHLWRPTAMLATLVVGALLFGAVALSRPLHADHTADLALIQHNRSPWASGDLAGTVETLQRLSDEAIGAAPGQPDLLVWSETALNVPIVGREAYYSQLPRSRPLLPYLRELDTYLLTGVPWVVGREPLQAMNAAMLAGPGFRNPTHYGKQHPVPFAESVPLWNVPFVRRFFVEVIGLRAIWVSGRVPTVFEIPLADGGVMRFSTPICFEDSFSDLNRKFVLAGADVLMNITNDAWSGTVSAETQHFVAAKLRAIENRRVLVRTTNGGVTVAIDPHGRRIGQAAPLFAETFLRVEVPIYTSAGFTFYTRFGDVLPALIGIVVLLIIVRHGWLGRRKTASSSVSHGVPAHSGAQTRGADLAR
jgi:apolipoprotein N-acyltransferase